MWDLKCIVAATCFSISNLLFTIYGVHQMRATSHSHDGDGSNEDTETESLHNFTHWKELDPIYIQERWVHQEASRPLMTWAGLFGCMAWFWFMVPILQSAWILSRGGKRLVGVHAMLASLAVVGGLIELLAGLLRIGMTNAAIWLAKDFNLDNWTSDNDGTGWRVLEMIHTVTHGMTVWVDAFESLAMFGIVYLLFFSVSTESKYKTKRSSDRIPDDQGLDLDDSDNMDRIGVELDAISNPDTNQPPTSAFNGVSPKVEIPPTFNKCFINYGLFIGALSIVDFVADVLRFVNWKVFGRLAMAINVVVGVVLLPIWLLIFAKQLPAATERFERMQQWDEMMDGDTEQTALVDKGQTA